MIDPVDGTDELAAGRDGYAISIALFHHERPIAALMDMPAQERRFDAAVGQGTVLNGEPARLSNVGDIGEAQLAVSATQRRKPSLRTFWEGVHAAKLVPTPGFAAKFAAVLGGTCDAALYLHIEAHPATIWDYAAPPSFSPKPPAPSAPPTASTSCNDARTSTREAG